MLYEIHTRIKVSKALDVSWKHHLVNDTCTEETGGELVLLTNRLLNTYRYKRQPTMSDTRIPTFRINVCRSQKRKSTKCDEGKDCSTIPTPKISFYSLKSRKTCLNTGMEFKGELARSQQTFHMVYKESIVLKSLSIDSIT